MRRLFGQGRAGGQGPSAAEYEAIAEYARSGPAAIAPGASEAAAQPSLQLAFVIPWFFEGSGGHTTIVDIARRLEQRGHDCSLWLHDPGGRHEGTSDEALATQVRDWFGPLQVDDALVEIETGNVGLDGRFADALQARKGGQADLVRAPRTRRLRRIDRRGISVGLSRRGAERHSR